MIVATMDQATFDALAEKLEAAEGISLKGTGGEVEKSGATVNWSYLGQELTLNVVHAPFGLKSFAESRLKDALEAQGIVCR